MCLLRIYKYFRMYKRYWERVLPLTFTSINCHLYLNDDHYFLITNWSWLSFVLWCLWVCFIPILEHLFIFIQDPFFGRLCSNNFLGTFLPVFFLHVVEVCLLFPLEYSCCAPLFQLPNWVLLPLKHQSFKVNVCNINIKRFIPPSSVKLNE